MRYIGGSNDENRTALFQWLDARVPGGFGPQPPDFRAIYYLQVNDDGTQELLAVIALTHFTPHSALMHIATDKTKRWASAKYLFEFYNYAFKTCGLTRLSGIAHHDNPESIRLHERLGHHLDCVLKHHDGRDKHAYLFSFTVEDWATSKWNRQRR